MSKRTFTSPFVVQYLRTNGSWFTCAYERNESLAYKAARNIVKSDPHIVMTRVKKNPNIYDDPTVLYTYSEAVIP